jgi:hypothetical protein
MVKMYERRGGPIGDSFIEGNFRKGGYFRAKNNIEMVRNSIKSAKN